MEITEHRVTTPRHSTFYRACGPEDGPLVIMTHGWPELSISWRHQLLHLGRLGYRAIAPDMRGYGWQINVDGKKHFAGTALFNQAGECCAYSKQVWIGRMD